MLSPRLIRVRFFVMFCLDLPRAFGVAFSPTALYFSRALIVAVNPRRRCQVSVAKEQNTRLRIGFDCA
jgi:hypothetical protein